MKEIGNRLKILRSGKSQAKFAKEFNLGLKTYQLYEQGKNIPNSGFLFELRKKLKVNIDWLLSGEGEPYLSETTDTTTKNELNTIDSFFKDPIQKTTFLMAQIPGAEGIVRKYLKEAIKEIEELFPTEVQKAYNTLKASDSERERNIG